MTLRYAMRPALAALLTLALWAQPALAAELIVSAAASLKDAFQAMQPAFEKANPGVTLKFNFAASGVLFRQIEEGAPVDVFATADQETMNRAQAKGLLLGGTRRDFAVNKLVLITPAGKTAVASAMDLSKPAVTAIAVGNPATVPVGRYARQALGDQWGALQAKFILAESVRQVLDYVARGEVDAGFVYVTDAMIQKDKVRVAQTLPTDEPISYPVAALAGSAQPAAAKAFAAFVSGPEAAAVLGSFGFTSAAK